MACGGLNVRASHDAIVRNFEQTIPRAAAARVPNVITFFGNRRGMSDQEATANCVAGLNRVKKIAEDHGVTICVELLNSKVNHPDYQGDAPPSARALPHRRRSRPPRARRDAGGELTRRLPRDRRHRLPRLPRPRVRADARSAHIAA